MQERIGGFLKVGNLPMDEELRSIKSRVDQNIVTVTTHQPVHHRDIHLARFIGASDQAGDGEILQSSIADCLDAIDGLGCGLSKTDRSARAKKKDHNT